MHASTHARVRIRSRLGLQVLVSRPSGKVCDGERMGKEDAFCRAPVGLASSKSPSCSVGFGFTVVGKCPTCNIGALLVTYTFLRVP